MTSVIIVGRVLEKIDENTRLMELAKPYKNNHGIFETFTVHVRHWNKGATCAFMQLKCGVSICLRGRLETDVKIGTYVLVEHIFGTINEV